MKVKKKIYGLDRLDLNRPVNIVEGLLIVYS